LDEAIKFLIPETESIRRPWFYWIIKSDIVGSSICFMAPINSLEFFRESYCALTGHPESFPWQENLFLRFCECDIPKDVNLPTGCGKTSAMVAWLLALAWQAQAGPEGVSLPRRLVWVVNRRVVVDQATSEAGKLKQRLKEEGLRELDPVRAALRKLSATNADDLIAVSTLRGQFADNAEWRDDPARPAVVVGTVDMVGSRLLFAGYGRGFKSRPLHAGFIGQDALLIHDEAHLEPAFQDLILAVESEQQRCRDFRRLRVMALTATSRGTNGSQFTLTDADLKHEEIQKRIEAKKGIDFHPVGDENKLATEVCRRALEFKDSGQAILIFLRKVEDVQAVASGLPKEKLGVQELTGTLRGYERDELARTDAVFARFMPDMTVAPKDGTVYLVCTSAGEVGVNMSADHLVCDLTPFDSMTQRLGRVNRFGEGEARVEIVYPTADQTSKKKRTAQVEFEQACERSLLVLQKLPKRADERYDGSPAALGELPLEDRQAAFTPSPAILATSDILFDAWALTSIWEKLPGRPPVAGWLHGIAEWEPPQTHVAWREEVELIAPELWETYKPEDLLEDYPLKPHELLRDASSRVSKQLGVIAGKLPDVSAWLVEPDGGVRALKLADLVSPEKRIDLGDCTILLPPKAGGLRGGMLDGDAGFDGAHHDLYDVSERWLDENYIPRRCRVWDSDEPPRGMRLVRTVDIRPDADDELSQEEHAPTRRFWRWYVRPRSADDDGSWTAPREQGWQVHTQTVERFARGLVTRLGLSDPEASAIVLAAGWNDLGKRRELWQRLIGNRDYPDRVLAKSGHNTMSGRSGYRHEFGSLVDVSRLAEFLRLKPDVQDLVLHVIAAHHGRARPHFPSDEAFDPECTEEIAAEIARETPRRFARLQRRYGRWGLAYVESLVRAADALASQDIRPEPDGSTSAPAPEAEP
jgi:CRISPR-associated endonuclease/helicase Cas3